MNAKIPLSLVCSAALAFACGPRARNDVAARSEATRVVRAVDANAPLSPALDVTVGREVTFSFQVMNAGKKKLEVAFPDGRTHDVVVLDSLGREVWRWSEGRMFTQAMQNRVLRTSDVLMYEEEWESPAPGHYVAVATLASRNYPVEQRVEFVVPQM
jgi:Intracellular proteinase inhibitor